MDDLGVKATQLCNNSSRCKALKTTQYDLKTSRIYLKKQFKALIQGIPPFWVTNSRDDLPKNMPKNCPLMHSFKISELINSKFQILVMEIFHQVSDPALSPRPFFFQKFWNFRIQNFKTKNFINYNFRIKNFKILNFKFQNYEFKNSDFNNSDFQILDF